MADIQTQAAFQGILEPSGWRRTKDIDPYNDLFCDLLEENAKAHPQISRGAAATGSTGHGAVDTGCNLPIFASGWGDGSYPVYFGYDEKDEGSAGCISNLLILQKAMMHNKKEVTAMKTF